MVPPTRTYPLPRHRVLNDPAALARRRPAAPEEVRSLWGEDFGLVEYRLAPGARLPVHGHPWASFNWVLAGDLTDRRGRRAEACGAGSTGFHPPGIEHRVDIGPRGGRAFHVELGGRWLDRCRSLGPLPESRFDHSGGPLADVLARLRAECWRWDASSSLVVEGLALELLGLLRRGARREAGRPPWIDRALELLREASERLTAEELARELDVSPVVLARAFRRHVGESVGEIGLRSRLRRAHLLLTTTDRTIADIAHDLGFADHAHLTRRFKRRYGFPPSRLRLLDP